MAAVRNLIDAHRDGLAGALRGKRPHGACLPVELGEDTQRIGGGACGVRAHKLGRAVDEPGLTKVREGEQRSEKVSDVRYGGISGDLWRSHTWGE